MINSDNLQFIIPSKTHLTMEELKASLDQYKDQLTMVNQALQSTNELSEKESLLTLQNDLTQLIQLTQESLDTLNKKSIEDSSDLGNSQDSEKTELDDEYALFMQEMSKSGAYEEEQKQEASNSQSKENQDEDSDIEDELASLLGMKCGVYHTHKWGGQPTLHNAMVSAVVPRQGDDQFTDLQVRVLFTHPTHTEMLPCPFYLEGECKFSDEQCRYSHGAITALSNLKEAIEPCFESLKPGSRILMKLKPPDDEDISLTKKSTEKYHLWHRAVVKSINLEEKICSVRIEHGVTSGEKRKSTPEEHIVQIEEIFPLNNDNDDGSSSDGSLSDTEYPASKARALDRGALLAEQTQHSNTPIGEWERHTRGIGSKLLLSMGYVAGAGLGARGAGRLLPVPARALPPGRGLDHCMAASEQLAQQDPLQVEKKLKRLQKKEEERNKRAYEREKERERRNVFNFLNRTLGEEQETQPVEPSKDIKQSTSKDLNIEQFKINEDVRKLEREMIKLNSSLIKYPSGSSGHVSISSQIAELNKELGNLKRRDQQITREQNQRKDKQKMTVF